MVRHERVAQAIKEEISTILHDQINDPRLGFVTIVRVELTQDLRSAKVFFSVLGKEQDYKKTKDALDSALGFIRRMVAQRIQLRCAPEITFREDHASEYSTRIFEVLEEIHSHDEPKKTTRKPKSKK